MSGQGGSSNGGADAGAGAGAGAGPGAGAGGGPPDLTLIPGYYDDQGSQIDAIVWALTAVSGIVVSLRLWCKHVKQRGLWIDDYLLGVSWV
jgi:hypothetical protein